MQLTIKKMSAALIAGALALCVAPAMAMVAPGQAHAAAKTNITSSYLDGDLNIDIETSKLVKQEQWDGGHWVDTAVYTGKQVKPKVTVSLYDPNYTGTKTNKYWDSSKKKIVTEKYTTHYRTLKAVNITGKTKKAAAKLASQKKADVTIEYKNNVKVGVAQVVIKGVRNYKGTVYSSFTISPKQIKTVKVTAAKKALKVSWSKVKGATGYQITVRDKDADTVVKTMTVDAKKKTAKVTGLKSKRTYQVSVRPYVADVASSYKTTDRVTYDVKWENTYDDEGYVDGERIVSSKKLTYTGSYQSNGTYWGDYSVAKAKKTK